jgi:DNA modification methylase
MKTNPGSIKETTLLLGDCLDKLKELDDNSIDSIVSDPPYGLSFMGKKWDYDVPSQAIWQECMRVLKPGGHLLSFAGSRTYHRMAVRIEDAGFEIRDQIMWVYGSGFPKSHNIGKAVDKKGGQSIGWFGQWLRDWREENNITQKEIAKLFPSKTGGLTGCVANWELGLNIPTTEQFNTIVENFDLPFKSIEELEREILGTKSSACFGNEERHTIGASKSVEVDITKGNSEWEGWGTALKPAHEPIVMARKPFKGTVADNVLEYGTGAINIDDCRIAPDDAFVKHIEKYSDRDVGVNGTPQSMFGNTHGKMVYGNVEGRFPANIIFDEEAGKILDEQSGDIKGMASQNCNNQTLYGGNAMNASQTTRSGFKQGYNDKGGASRFFYCPKASKKDREEGMNGLVKKANVFMSPDSRMDKDQYERTSPGMERFKTEPKSNFHPTVKPTDLMQYLIRLVTKKGGVVLDPFMGSGSTGKAAIKEGMIFVGIEREEEYFEIAKQRIENEIHKNEPKHNFW